MHEGAGVRPLLLATGTGYIAHDPEKIRRAMETLTMAKPRTLYDKIWDDHLVDEQPDGTALIYIDRHLVHEVTSPQAFEGLRTAGRKVRRPELTLAVADHNVPTKDRDKGITD